MAIHALSYLAINAPPPFSFTILVGKHVMIQNASIASIHGQINMSSGKIYFEKLNHQTYWCDKNWQNVIYLIRTMYAIHIMVRWKKIGHSKLLADPFPWVVSCSSELWIEKRVILPTTSILRTCQEALGYQKETHLNKSTSVSGEPRKEPSYFPLHWLCNRGSL